MEDSKNPSRTALIEAAQQLFTEKAYEAVSTRELAEKARVNLGAIQYYFGSKAKLFATSLQHMMEAGPMTEIYALLDDEANSRDSAARMLCQFVRAWLGYLIGQDGPHACRCMFREILSENSDKELSEVIVSEFVENYSRPLSTRLQRIISVLEPRLSPEEIPWFVQSIVSQCVFYVSHRPFIEHMREIDLSDQKMIDQVAKHVSRFSLRGLGCSADFIEQAINL